METIWPRYELYSADEIKRSLGRSRFIFITLALLMVGAMAFATFNASTPAIVAYTLGALLNLFGWFFVSRRHGRNAAGVITVCNVLVAMLHVLFLQADVALWIALAIYSINMLRATITLRKMAA
jgi:O-antigen/teichoic acid export membrane protein